MAEAEWVFALAFVVAMAGVFAANRYARSRAWPIERRRLVTMLCLFCGMFLVMDCWLLFGSGGTPIAKVLFFPLLLALQLGSVWLVVAILNRISSAIAHLLRTD